jgi:hypothetical protein
MTSPATKGSSGISTTEPSDSTTVPAAQAASLDEIARAMGPFSPPRDYRFEPELLGAPPRTVPPDCRTSPAAARLRRAASACVLIGLACLMFSRVHFVRELSYYLLPLGYLSWIGGGLLLIGTLLLGTLHLPGGPLGVPFKYIKRGQPVVARILQKGLFRSTVKVHGSSITHFGYETGVQLLNPENGRLENIQVRSDEIGTVDKASHFREPFEVGDYVTLVYLPGKLEKTARIYSLLGVSGTAPFIEKDGRPWERGMSAAMTLAVVGLVIAGFGLLLSAIYSIEFRFPVSENDSAMLRPMIPVFAILAPLCGWGMWKLLKRESSKGGTQRRFARLWAVLAGLVGGAMGSAVLVAFINSALDRSPPLYQEFEVVNLWEETHDGVIRTYKIEYEPLGGGKRQKYPANHETLEKFSVTVAGVAQRHRGFLGLPWIRAVYPMQAELAKDALTSQPRKGVELADLIHFVATTDSGERVPASPRLVQRIMQKYAARDVERELRDRNSPHRKTPNGFPNSGQ